MRNTILLLVTALVACAAPPGGPDAEVDGGSTDDAGVDAGSDPLPPEHPPALAHVPLSVLLGDRTKTRVGEPDRLILGSTGKRTWAISMDSALGFSGELNYVHELGYGGSNLGGSAFTLSLSTDAGPLEPGLLAHRYWPDHLAMTWDAGSLGIVEEKFITADDCMVDVLQLSAAGGTQLSVRATAPLLSMAAPDAGALAGDTTIRGVATHFAVAGQGLAPMERAVQVSPAQNASRIGKPEPSASYTWWSDSVWAAIDGSHAADPRWTSYGSGSATDWLAVDLGRTVSISKVTVDLYDDSSIGGSVRPPAALSLQVRTGTGAWTAVAGVVATPSTPAPGLNELSFPATDASALRITFTHRSGFASGVLEVEVGPQVAAVERWLEGTLDVPAGKVTRAVVANCIGTGAAVDGRLISVLADPSPLATHRAAFDGWFDTYAPRFLSPDPYFTNTWAYRWYVVRYNLAEIEAGLLRKPAFYEGREFYSRVIQFSTPHILDESRWLTDGAFAFGHLENMVDSQLDANTGQFDGELPYLYADGRSNFYFINWIPQAAWGVNLVHPRADFAAAFGPPLERALKGELSRYDSDHDYLLKLGAVDTAFYATGMEYQPAFYWFAGTMNLPIHQYPDIERVDFTSYAYGNARALSALYAASGNQAKAQELAGLANEIRAALSSVMWSSQDTFFYDLDARSHQPAKVKEVVGFYPFAFGAPFDNLTEQLQLFDHLGRDSEFWARFPVSSTSRDSQFFSQTVPGGCCHWNGPSWPFSTSVVVEAVARAVKDYGAVDRRPLFVDLLTRYTRQHFVGEDLSRPFLSESMNGDTGVWKSRVENYFHSTYNDLLIRHIGGLTPRADEVIELSPIPMGWKYFAFENIRYHGRSLTIVWDEPDGDDQFGDGYEGLAVWADGQRLFGHPRLAHLRFDPATGQKQVLP